MEFRYFDRTKGELTIAEVEMLAIWNPTMEHIFGRAMERLGQDKSGVEKEVGDGFKMP